jgi:hypothetical protein
VGANISVGAGAVLAAPVPVVAEESALLPASPPLLPSRDEPARVPGELVFHFSPLPSNPTLPYGLAVGNFTGTRGLHMSAHACVGSYGGPAAVLPDSGVCTFKNFFCTDPFNGTYPNRTCSFHNLYFAGAPADPPPYSSHDWFYFAPVSREELGAPGWDAAAARARLKAEFRVDLLSRLKQDTWWRIEVLFFLAEPASGGLRVNIVRPPPPARRLGASPGPLNAPVVFDAEGCTLLDGATNASVYSGLLWSNTSTLVAAAAAAGLACLPAGVQAFTPRSFFFFSITHGSNIGHTLWDDLIPFSGAATALQLPFEGLDFLITVVMGYTSWKWNEADPPPWAGDQGVRSTVAYSSPNMEPVFVATLAAQGMQRLVHVARVAGGLTGFSPHNFRPNHVVFGAEPPTRSVWAFRQHVLRQMGFSEEEALRGARALPPPSPAHNVSLLFVRGKRGINDLEGLMAGIRSAYPHVHVGSVAWEETGGILNEAKILANTHILASLDGTASLKTFFMPPGAVFIELGVGRPWGSQMLCDFLHGAYDHVRVLHYDQLAPGEHEGHQHGAITVPLQKLSPFLDRALALLRDGFAIPLEPGVNLDPNALLLRFLMQRYPELAYHAVDLWNNGELKAARVFEGAEEWYSSVIGPPPPRLREDIERFCSAQPCGMAPLPAVPLLQQ